MWFMACEEYLAWGKISAIHLGWTGNFQSQKEVLKSLLGRWENEHKAYVMTGRGDD